MGAGERFVKPTMSVALSFRSHRLGAVWMFAVEVSASEALLMSVQRAEVSKPPAARVAAYLAAALVMVLDVARHVAAARKRAWTVRTSKVLALLNVVVFARAAWASLLLLLARCVDR
jgi:hypothetical protein